MYAIFRYSTLKALFIGMFCTMFDFFNIPVFWPILVLYFIILFTITMKKQIRVCIRYVCLCCFVMVECFHKQASIFSYSGVTVCPYVHKKFFQFRYNFFVAWPRPDMCTSLISTRSKVKIKVTELLQFRKLHFSRPVSSAIFAWNSKLMVDYDSMGPSLQRVRDQFLNFLLSMLSRDFKLCRVSSLQDFQMAIFSKHEQQTWVHVRYMLLPVHLSVCLSSVTFVRPTQAVQIFGNISTALGTMPSADIHWKFHGDRPRGTHPPGQLKLNTRGVAKYSDFGPIDGYISETVQDRR